MTLVAGSVDFFDGKNILKESVSAMYSFLNEGSENR
jgi:hypothetical protein